MSEQEKKRQRKISLSFVYKGNIFFIPEKYFLRERGSGKLNKNEKNGSLTAHTTVIKKDPTTPIWKEANELNVHEKTVRTEIIQD